MIARSLPRLFVLLTVALSFSALLAVFVPQRASAVDFFPDNDPTKEVCAKNPDAAACSGDGEDTITGTEGIILRAASLLAILASVAAVIGLMIAGITFISANGDSSKLSNAKQMIIYIVIGLIAIYVARAIVVFIVNNV